MQNIISLMYVLPNRSHGVVPHKFADALRMRNQIDGAVTRGLAASSQSTCSLSRLMDILRALLLAFLVDLHWKIQSVKGYSDLRTYL